MPTRGDVARPAPAPRIAGLAAAGFALLVVVLAFGLTALAFLALHGNPRTLRDLLVPEIVVAVLSIAATAFLLWRWPPRSRWGVGWRAAVGCLAGVVATIVSAPIVFPGRTTGGTMLILIAVAVFALSGSWFIPGAAAALCAPLLGTRFRPWRTERNQRRLEALAWVPAATPPPTAPVQGASGGAAAPPP